MASGSPLSSAFAVLDGANPNVGYRREYFMGDPMYLISANPFTFTNTNNTVTVANIGGRPALQITDGNTGATDKTNICVATATVIPQAGKIIRLRGSWWASTTTTDQSFGLSVVGTGLIAADATDTIQIQKLSAASVFSLRCRKASGTVQAFALNMAAVAASTWYDWEIWIRQPLGAAAGTGHVDVFWGAAQAGGGPLTNVGSFDLASQFPDTVATALFASQRAGATDAGTTGISLLAIEQEL